jgi:hypothetical protein
MRIALAKTSRKAQLMKIVVIGGTGLIGSKTVSILRERGHEVVAASPQSGVNTLTGEGLDDALAGAQVVVDLANSPSFEDKAVLEFFRTSEGNLLPAEEAAGVRLHVALSIVGIDRCDNGYFRISLRGSCRNRHRRLGVICDFVGHATRANPSAAPCRRTRGPSHFVRQVSRRSG